MDTHSYGNMLNVEVTIIDTHSQVNTLKSDVTLMDTYSQGNRLKLRLHSWTHTFKETR